MTRGGATKRGREGEPPPSDTRTCARPARGEGARPRVAGSGDRGSVRLPGALEPAEVVHVRAPGVRGLRHVVPRLGGGGVDRMVRIDARRGVAARDRALRWTADPELAHHVVVLVDEVVAVHHVAPGALAGPAGPEARRLLVVALLRGGVRGAGELHRDAHRLVLAHVDDVLRPLLPREGSLAVAADDLEV